jgi:4'-phosphopantetheinyl transferase
MKPRDGIWRVACGMQRLVPKEVHVWRAKLKKPASVLATLQDILSTDEIKRAKRFYFNRDRRRYIVKHAILRFILGNFYLNCRPQALRFGTNRYGKPYLKRKFDEDSLFFNVSDSNELALFAFARNSKIGIDLEYLRPVPDATKIATQFFSKQENAALQALPQQKQQEAFFNCWTRKEAFIKATGRGLNYPLNNFAVSLVPKEAARLIRVGNECRKADEWSLISMAPMTGYVGALAVKMKNLNVKFWSFPNPTYFE